MFVMEYSSVLFYFLPILFTLFSPNTALNNGLVKTPPMGWLSWEQFACKIQCNVLEEFADCISEKLFTQIADSLVQKGYKDAGYDRVNIDDCWMSKSRDVISGRLMPDPVRFPNGIKYLSDYMHTRGLKLGIYQNFGKRTCMNYPGLLGYSEKDAQTFADWKVDMIKLDGCFTPTTWLDKGYVEFGRFLLRTGRPIVYSCSWPYYQVFVSQKHIIPNWDMISLNCNLFRVYHDIHPNWDSILETIDFMADNQNIFRRITGPGTWPDPDMLLIGNPGLTINQAQVQMAVWCILPAPLFMSNDPRTIEDKYERILLNQEAIKINQDQLAIPAERIFHNETVDLWRRELSSKQMAIVILNRSKKSINVEVPFESINTIHGGRFQVLDIFADNSYTLDQNVNSSIKAYVKPTGVVFLKLSPLN